MGVGPAIFESGGQRTEHWVPGSYSRSYNTSSPSGVSAGNMVILGKSNGGKPFELLEFDGVASAQEALVGGELLDAIGDAFTASNVYIPQRVFAMRVNDGTQSSVTLQSGSIPTIEIKSWDYGVHTNQLKIMISDGTAQNSKKINLVYKEIQEEVDNIVKKAMNVVYYGEGQNATVTINNNSISFVAESIPEEGSEPTAIDELTLSFEDFDTLDSLVSAINNSNSYQAIADDVDLSSYKLDTITNSPIDIDNGLQLYANFDAFINALNKMSLIGGLEILETTTRQVPDNTESYIYFTGGTIGSYTITQWQQALKALEVEDIQIISTPSTDASVLSLISSHCTSMSSTINRKERTAILGGGIGMADTDGINTAQGLNNKLVSYVIDNATKTNAISGKIETITGARLGVMLAAMESAMSPSTPLTFKTLNVLSFGKIRDIPNITSLIRAGITVCNPNPENLAEYICVRSVTTFQGDDLINNERSMVREDLFMNRDLRAQFIPIIGGSGVSTNEAIKTLIDRAKEWALNGYIVPNDSNDNVWNIKCRIDGDKIYLTYSRYLTAPVNFVFITAVNHVYTSTVEI